MATKNRAHTLALTVASTDGATDRQSRSNAAQRLAKLEMLEARLEMQEYQARHRY